MKTIKVTIKIDNVEKWNVDEIKKRNK